MFKKRLLALFMTALLVFSFTGCGSEQPQGVDNQEKKEPIKIATKQMTEQYILGELLKALIEEKTDYKVELTKGIQGGTSNIQPAMESGEFDLYPEYTSSGWVLVLKHEKGSLSDEEMFEALKKEYTEQFNMTWVSLYGFNNTYTLVCRKDTADQYNLKTTSDMAAVSENLVFGANPDYIERADGYGILKETYGLNFKDVKDIDIGLKYQAMDSGDIDVTNGYTTDAQLAREDVVALEDDKHLQVNYFCSTVVRNEALEEYEGLEEVLELMEGLISDKEMATMNYEVEVEGKDEAEVAKAFLTSKGLLGE